MKNVTLRKLCTSVCETKREEGGGVEWEDFYLLNLTEAKLQLKPNI